MTTFTIRSIKLSRVQTFTHFANDAEGKTSCLWANTNGKEGTLGDQCMSRGFRGTALRVTEKNARRVAYQWLRKMYE